MPTLHALLVSIDNYPNPRHVLQGCVNDAYHLHQYLETYCGKMGFGFRPLALTDSAATRQAIIEGFEHFEAAEAEDCCLLFYSGHGSRSAAPEAFREIEHDHALESIVCWDSREPGGHDLMDKELSYLIWRAAAGKNLPFVSILDCCHSGSMRGIAGDILGVRTLRDVGPALPAAQFLGIEHYQKTKTGQLSPPLGRRVHLAAARDTELAKEVNAGGQPRGIFTYCLIEALNANGPLISYADLINRVNPRIKNAVPDQSAQIEATFTEDKNLGFLFSRIDAERPSYLISWDKTLGWMLNAGALNGISAGTSQSPSTVEIKEDGRLVPIESVLPDRSKISGMDGYDTKRAYVASIHHSARPMLLLGFAPGSDPKGVEILKDLSLRMTDPPFHLQDSAANADYLIQAGDKGYFLRRTQDSTPLFQAEQGYSEAAANSFLRNLNKVAQWHQLRDLVHPDTGIRDADIQIELFRMAEARSEQEMDNDVPVEALDWRANPAAFPYFQKNGTFMQPAFQLKLRNTGSRGLWVSILYLDSSFCITNQLLPKVLLDPGQEIWAQDGTYRTIPLQLEERQISQGITTVDEYIKVILSTEELNTDFYHQRGLTTDSGTESTRLFGRKDITEQKDWATKTIWFRIEG